MKENDNVTPDKDRVKEDCGLLVCAVDVFLKSAGLRARMPSKRR